MIRVATLLMISYNNFIVTKVKKNCIQIAYLFPGHRTNNGKSKSNKTGKTGPS